MRYQGKSAIAYMFRNFWKLVIITLPAAVLMAFYFNFSAETEIYKQFVLGKLTADDFWNMSSSAFSVLKYGGSWWQSLITFVVLIFTFSMMAVKVERHMRVGKMPILPLKSSFKVFPIMALYVSACFAAIEVVMLIPLGIMYLLRSIQNIYAIVILNFAMNFIARTLLSYLFAMLLVAFPLKFRENYRFNTALSYSVRITSKQRKYLVAFSFGYPAARLIVGILAKLLEQFKLDVLIYALFFLFLITYIPCLAFKLYHDSLGVERRDVNQIIFG